MSADMYILDKDNKPVPAPDLMRWGRWMEENRLRRIVAQTTTEHHWISTVFLGINHNLDRYGPPTLFETMVFEKEHTIKDIFGRLMQVREEAENGFERYATWEQAKRGHRAMVRRFSLSDA